MEDANAMTSTDQFDITIWQMAIQFGTWQVDRICRGGGDYLGGTGGGGIIK